MIPNVVLARVQSVIGDLVLAQRGNEFSLRLGREELMNSRVHQSEDALGTRVCAELRRANPRVLVGGLGFGYTLRAALDAMPRQGVVEIAEIVPEVIAWNRGVLAHLARRPLDDPRVVVYERDVAEVIASHRESLDAIALDVDNGPDGMHARNNKLYQQRGLAAARAALVPGGVLGVWSSFASNSFTRWLRDAGFVPRVVSFKRRTTCYLWLARKT